MRRVNQWRNRAIRIEKIKKRIGTASTPMYITLNASSFIAKGRSSHRTVYAPDQMVMESNNQPNVDAPGAERRQAVNDAANVISAERKRYIV